jgi:hypothetical protein
MLVSVSIAVRLQPSSEAKAKRVSIELNNPDMFGPVTFEPKDLVESSPVGVPTPIEVQMVGPGALAGVARTPSKDFVDTEPQAARRVILSKFLATENEAVLGNVAVGRTSGESPEEQDSRQEGLAKSSPEEMSHSAGLEAQAKQLVATEYSGDVKDVAKVLGTVQEKGTRRESNLGEGLSSALLENDFHATRTSSSHCPMKETETVSEISEDTTTISSVGLSHRSSSGSNQMLRIGSTSSDEQVCAL